MSVSFNELGLKPWIVASLKSLHIEIPTAIQAACIGPALAGRDVIGCGETGAGKTLAFGLPILQALSNDLYGIAALILTPSRELAVQISEQLTAVGAPLKLQVVTVIGGMDQVSQSQVLSTRPHVIVATPGRLAELLSLKVISLAKLSWLVLDEADRLLSLGFQDQLQGFVLFCFFCVCYFLVLQ
jgi:ATP-dependent RNA helicase DDX49/DBP8